MLLALGEVVQLRAQCARQALGRLVAKLLQAVREREEGAVGRSALVHAVGEQQERLVVGEREGPDRAGFGGVFLLLGYLLRDQIGARSRVGGVLPELSALFLPGRLFGSRLPPQDLAGRLLFAWVFLLFWTVVLGALTASFLRTCAFHDAAEADQARAILTRGGSTLSYMSTWAGNKYWISSDGRAAIAYRAIGTIAVTVGDPFGEQAELDSVIAEFAGFCEDRGLRACLYSATGQSRAAAQRLGWTSVQIAEDTLLPLERLQFTARNGRACGPP